MRQAIKGHNINPYENMNKSTKVHMQTVLDELNKGCEISVNDGERLLPLLESKAIRRMCIHLETVRGIPIDMVHKPVGRQRVSFFKLGLEVEA